MKKFINRQLENQCFGIWKVLKRKTINYDKWICECVHCGIKLIKPGILLISGKLTKCQHCASTINLKNKCFGKWTVLRQVSSKTSNSVKVWECQCECGIISNISTYALLHKKSSACKKCSKNIKLDLIGKQFGYLKVIDRDNINSTNKITYWKCECLKCGKICKTTRQALNKSRNNSCGCWKYSLGKEQTSWRGYKNIPLTYFTYLKKQAYRRNIEFDLTIEYLWELWEKQNSKCSLSGMEIKLPLGSKNFHKKTCSLDRINSIKGYIKGNVQWVHKDVNMMKQKYSEDYFITLCKNVTNHNKELI